MDPLVSSLSYVDYSEGIVSLSNEYEVISFLGKGDKAEVFLVKNPKGNLFALKKMYSKEQLSFLYPEEYQYVLDLMFASDGSSIIASEEFLTSQRLIHPNIIRIEKLFTERDNEGNLRSCLLMEFVDGKTLADTLPRSFSRKTAIHNTIQLLDALVYAAKNHYVHKDLYRSNIMFTQHNEIKIIDLDSFENDLNSDNDCSDCESCREYLRDLFNTLMDILACGDFKSEELNRFSKKINQLLDDPSYIDKMNAALTDESFEFLEFFLQSVKKLLSVEVI